MEPTHKCCKCKRTEDDSPNFLGFHQYRRGEDKEVCDDCAEVFGCNCCKVPGNYIPLYDYAAIIQTLGGVEYDTRTTR